LYTQHAAISLGLGVAVALVVFNTKKPAPPTNEAPAAAPPRIEEVLTLQIDVTPPDARVFLDDALLSTGSYKGNLPKDGRVYRLRIEATGYTSRVELLKASSNARLEISLEKLVAANADQNPKPPLPKSKLPSTSTNPTLLRDQPEERPKQIIETKNPY